MATTYSALEWVAKQRGLGLLASYTIEMGGDIALFEAAMRIPAWEALRPLTQEEVRHAGLDTAANVFDEAAVKLEASRPGQPAPRFLASSAGGDLKISSWGSVERAGATILARQYPLTLQGEEIGHFEISFGCGDKDHYKAAYSETRRIAEEKPVRLVGLAIATAGKQVATFNVVSSLRDMREANMSSIASGTVSPAFMGELTRNGGQSLAVATIDSNKVKTVIIIGPVGLSAGSKQFLAKCNIPSPDDGPAPHRVMGPR